MENDIKTKRKGYMSVSQKEQLIELLTEEHSDPVNFHKVLVNKLQIQSGIALRIN